MSLFNFVAIVVISIVGGFYLESVLSAWAEREIERCRWSVVDFSKI